MIDSRHRAGRFTAVVARAQFRVRLRLYLPRYPPPATVVAIGLIMLPAMVKAVIRSPSASEWSLRPAVIRILIPPRSSCGDVYAVSTNSSIGALFIAGIALGLLLALCSVLPTRTGRDLGTTAYRAPGEGLSSESRARAALRVHRLTQGFSAARS